MSVLVGQGLPAADGDVLGEAAALAALHAARELLPHERFFLKWPNDVVTWGKGRSIGKLAGVVTRSEVAGAEIARAAVGIGLNVASVVEDVELGPGAGSAVSLEGIARRSGTPFNAPRIKVVEWLTGWYGASLARVRESPEAVRKEFARELSRAPLHARVAGVRDEFRPLGVDRGGALVVRRRSGKRATVKLEDAERLVWAIDKRPKAAAKRAKRPTSARPRAGPSAPPRSSRARSAPPARRRQRRRR
jgi:biotin-(acetyl-CoA carboxylase) ligase